MQTKNLTKKEERQVLVFRSGRQELGLDISCVREVLRPQETYPLPKTPHFIEGVINLRGRIVPLIDLGKRLHAGQREEDPNKRIIVCKANGFIIGLVVNSLREIVALPREDIEPTPQVVSMRLEAEVMSGLARVGQRIIPILDLDRLLMKEEVGELATLEL